MVATVKSDSSSSSHPLARFRKASQAIHASQGLDEVLARIVAELHAALDAEAASVALLDGESGEIILRAAGPVAESISGLQFPPEHGIIGWVVSTGQSAIINDVSVDVRFWPDIDGYSGFETRSALCTPLLSGSKVIGALEVLNKHEDDFTTEDLNFLEAFSAVAASAIENARLLRQEQRRRLQTDILRRAWEALTTPRDLEALLDVILDQLAQLIDYRSASILLVTEEGGLELGASRGLVDLAGAPQRVAQLGLDVKISTMLETYQPVLIPDTRTDARWRYFPEDDYIRSWIGAPLLVKGHLIGTLNVDHDQPGYYNISHARLLTSFAHQAAVAIENSRLYDATREATMQLAEQARRMVTLYETSRALLSGLELDQMALRELIGRITDLTKARYGVLDILAENGRPALFITVGFDEDEVADLNWVALRRGVLNALNDECEVIRNVKLLEEGGSLPDDILNSSLGVAIHARGRMLGRLLLAGKQGNRPFSRDDEALALALATNLAGAVENASLYHNTQQRVRELTVLYEISDAVTKMSDISDIYTRLVVQIASLLDVERCAFFIYQDGRLECQPPGCGIPPEFIPRLSFEVDEKDPLYAVIHTVDPLVNNDVMRISGLAAQRTVFAQLGVRRMLSCSVAIDEQRTGLLVATDKRGGAGFGEQDRHLVSIIIHQVNSMLQRALLQSRQQEDAQIQSALLRVSHAISSLIDLDELLQRVAQITHQLVGCDYCLIASWEEKLAAFVPRAQSGPESTSNEVLSEVCFRPSELAFINQVVETREPLLLARQDTLQVVPSRVLGVLDLEPCLVVPLVIQERVVGLIAVAYARENCPPGERETTLVTGIARQAAIAIENANLFNDLQLHARRLERAYSELEELDERKTQFIQNVSHELRTPFTLVKGYVELLLDEEFGALNDSQKEALAAIDEKTAGLIQLVNNIVTIQSIDAGSLNPHEFDICTLLRSVLESARANAPDALIQSDCSHNLPLVKADSALVGQVLKHLLDNAIKFSPDGGVITLRARPEDGVLYIEVTDQGIGIPSEVLPYIFDRFYQVDGSTTRRFGGAGLGLAIVKQIVEAHSGQVGVRSIEGRGSTFYFTLPSTSSSDTE